MERPTLLRMGGFSLFSRNGYPLRVQGEQAYTSGSYCKAVKTAWSPRHPFRPCGKTCTASFRGDAWQNAILPRFTDRRRMKVFCDKIIVKREVTAQNTLRLRLKGNTLHAPLWFSPRFAASRKKGLPLAFAAKLHPNPPHSLALLTLSENPHGEF